MGDEIRNHPFRYRVIRSDERLVTYELIHESWGYISDNAVTPETWRAMVAGFTPLAQEKKSCLRCNGTGWLQGRPTIHDTDSAAEMADAYQLAKVCCECRK
jgi:hypothetical protein